MQLTEEERHWALAIKAAVEERQGLEPLNDFQYDQGNFQVAVDKAVRLQSFRESHDIQYTPEDSRRYLAKLVDLFPQMYLSYAFNPVDGHYYFVYGISQFSIQNLTLPTTLPGMPAIYYLSQAMSVDLDLIRRGVIVLAECGDYHYRRSMTTKIIEQTWLELAWCYPLQYQAVKHYNTGVLFNVFLSMLKRIISTKMASKFHTGLQTEHPLPHYYLVPHQQAAQQRFLQQVHAALKRRYELEQSFTLS